MTLRPNQIADNDHMAKLIHKFKLLYSRMYMLIFTLMASLTTRQ